MHWSCRKKFRRLLDRNILGDRSSRLALVAALTRAKALKTSPDASPDLIMTSTTIPLHPHSQGKRQESSSRTYMTRADSYVDYYADPLTGHGPPAGSPDPAMPDFDITKDTINALKAAFQEYITTGIPSADIKSGLNNAASTLKSTIKPSLPQSLSSSSLVLKQDDDNDDDDNDQNDGSSTPLMTASEVPAKPSSPSSHNSIPPSSSSSSSSTPSTTPPSSDIQYTSITYDSFLYINTLAQMSYLGSREIFNVFDRNRDGTVDYMEFLLTLSIYRKDINWNDSNSVARLYYCVFDMNDLNSISIDILSIVLNKVLAMTDGDEPGHNSASGTMPENTLSDTRKISSIQNTGTTATTTYTNNNTTKTTTSVGGAGGISDGVDASPLSSSFIYDIIQSIDTKDSGKITLTEFQALFDMILKLKTLSIV